MVLSLIGSISLINSVTSLAYAQYSPEDVPAHEISLLKVYGPVEPVSKLLPWSEREGSGVVEKRVLSPAVEDVQITFTVTETASGDLTLPTFTLPNLTFPSFPTITLPSLPTITIPSLPTITIPSLPTLTPPEIPSLPTLTPPVIPSLPTLTPPVIPSLPTLTPPVVPSLPTLTPPEIPSLPTLTPPEIPSLPTLTPPEIPSLPTLTPPVIPSLPTVTLPSLPSLPTVTLPSLPSVTIPTLTAPAEATSSEGTSSEKCVLSLELVLFQDVSLGNEGLIKKLSAEVLSELELKLRNQFVDVKIGLVSFSDQYLASGLTANDYCARIDSGIISDFDGVSSVLGNLPTTSRLNIFANQLGALVAGVQSSETGWSKSSDTIKIALMVTGSSPHFALDGFNLLNLPTFKDEIAVNDLTHSCSQQYYPSPKQLAAALFQEQVYLGFVLPASLLEIYVQSNYLWLSSYLNQTAAFVQVLNPTLNNFSDKIQAIVQEVASVECPLIPSFPTSTTAWTTLTTAVPTNTTTTLTTAVPTNTTTSLTPAVPTNTTTSLTTAVPTNTTTTLTTAVPTNFTTTLTTAVPTNTTTTLTTAVPTNTTTSLTTAVPTNTTTILTTALTPLVTNTTVSTTSSYTGTSPKTSTQSDATVTAVGTTDRVESSPSTTIQSTTSSRSSGLSSLTPTDMSSRTYAPTSMDTTPGADCGADEVVIRLREVPKKLHLEVNNE